ncbi:penicillin acylase family protein, partial [Citreimonas sp.]|uniref:penicillin acylase family protein n=1 Tax=Citreimonas sp. TaxID=3036715 RepID=UPI0035C8496A
MATLFRWLLRLVSAALVLAVIGAGLVYYLASRSLPDYDKVVAVEGAEAEIEIVRDNSAVPHIFAESDADAYFGLGYAHAQDRLWQMMTLRRTAQGRLSELFGRRTVETDTLLRRLDLYGLARQAVEAQTPETTEALSAYAAGVNARLAEINADSLGRGAPEFFIFDTAIAPWQPADSIAIIKLMALQLSGHLSEEVLRARVSMTLEDEARLADILPDIPGHGIAALPEYASLAPGLRPGLPVPETGHAFLSPVPKRGLAGASNAWAAAASRSAGGGTLLANDPHLGF